MRDFSFEIANPWLLLLLIPALIIGIIPFFRLAKHRRKATKHIIPFIIHMLLVFLLTTTLSGMRIVETTTAPTDTSIVFVVDVSESNEPMEEQMNTFIREVIKQGNNQEGKVEYSFIPFAGSVLEDNVKKKGEYTLGDELDIIQYDDSKDRSSSNIQAALAYLFNEKGEVKSEFFGDGRINKRVIILSDGRETHGNALVGAQKLINKDIRVDAASFDIKESTKAEIQIVEVTTNGKVELDKEAMITVSVKSTINVTGKLTIFDGDYKHEQTVNIRKGDNKYPISYKPKTSGMHTIYANITVGSDTLEQNNTLCSWYKVDSIGKILVVYGTPDQKQQMPEIVKDYLVKDYQVDTIDNLNQFPATMVDMLEYDEIVLMNVDAGKLPENTSALLKRYVEENGRGLVVTCGSTAYDPKSESYYSSPLAEILPVDMKIETEKETVAVVMICDLSSSMREKMGDRTRYDVALDSIKQAVDALDVTKDYLGVIIFDETVKTALEMIPIESEANREAIKEKIEYEFEHYYYEHFIDANGNDTDIRVRTNDSKNGVHPDQAIYLKPVEEGGYGYTVNPTIRWGTHHYTTFEVIKAHGTRYSAPISAASNMLGKAKQEYRLDIKQVVFMSDGQPNDAGSGYEAIVKLMYKAGIVTSTIGIGDDINSNAEKELRLIAEAGHTEPVFIKDPTKLPGTLFDIVQSIQGEYYNTHAVSPKEFDNSPILAGVVNYDTLNGYYGTTIKEGATMVLYVDNLKPLIAEWQYGLGKVSVFMSDFGTNWTQAMFESTDGQRLIYNLLTSAMNEQTDSTGLKITEEPRREDGKTTIRVETPVNVRKPYVDANGVEHTEEERLVAVIISENGVAVEKEFEFTKIGSKKYRVIVDTPDETEQGNYVIEIRLVDSTGMEDVLYDKTDIAVVGYYKEEYDIYAVDGKAVMNDIAKNQSTDNSLVDTKQPVSIYNVQKEDIAEYVHTLDDEFIIASLILFLVSIFFRNFVFQKETKKKEMTDEEQIESMRGSGR